jgi:two-component system, chemotaxis family, sensor kinase Cph1
MRFWLRFVVAERSAPLRYGVAVCVAVLALLLVHWLNRLENTQLSSFAFLSVVISALYGGMGPALVAASLTAVGIDYFFAEPRFTVFDTWASVLRVATYGIAGFLVASVVASLREAYRELLEQHRQTDEARQARENVLAIVSHDLRSPLSAILLSVGYLRRAAHDNVPVGELRSTLDGLHRSAVRMRRLVDDLLDLAAIDAGRFKIETGLHDLVPIVEDAVETVRSSAEAKGVQLVLSVAEHPLPVHCDRERITQVLSNLIGNAVKFSPDGAAVEVGASTTADWIRVEVRDCGPGIDAAQIPHLFTKYWQAAGSGRKGTGLGLFIAKSIIDAHGGRIEVASEVGRGSRFSACLPRRPAADSP